MRAHLLFLLVAALLLLAAILYYVWNGQQVPGSAGTAAQILFLSWDEQNTPQLYVTSPAGEPLRALTQAEQGVASYAVAPDGSAIAYATGAGDGGNGVWLVDRDGRDPRRVLACRGFLCGGLAWAPDGRRLVYERRPPPIEGEPDEGAALWWLDPATGETTPVFAGEQDGVVAAGFSADGNWLSVVVPEQEVTRLHNVETGRTVTIPNRVGAPPAWHPADNRLVSSDIEYQGERFAVHLYHVDVQSGEMTAISDQAETNDGTPAWSPDGQRLAFGRRIPRAPVGRQLWIMDAEGSESRQLTADPESNFGPPCWSPDGRWLLTQRYQIDRPDDRPSIWLLEVASGELRQVAPSGYAPAWLP